LLRELRLLEHLFFLIVILIVFLWTWFWLVKSTIGHRVEFALLALLAVDFDKNFMFVYIKHVLVAYNRIQFPRVLAFGTSFLDTESGVKCLHFFFKQVFLFFRNRNRDGDRLWLWLRLWLRLCERLWLYDRLRVELTLRHGLA